MIEARTLHDESKFQESGREISIKVLRGEYRLLRRKHGSTVWQVYREVVRSDGAIINGFYFCTGCKRVMRSFNTSNLRTHKCHVEYLRRQEPNAGTFTDAEPSGQEDADLPPENRFAWNNFKPSEWSYHATEMLLQLWAANCVDLRDSRRRVKVIWKMTGEMKSLHFTFTEIKNKIDDMSQRYRREAHQEKTTGQPSQWEYYETLNLIFNAEKNLVEDKPRKSDNSGHGSTNALKSGPIKKDNFDLGEDQDDSQDDVDELRILKDNIIREIEESSTVHSQENYEDELDQQNSTIEEIKRTKRKRAARMMEIEEEKLVIERKKCKLMKFFVREMSSFHKDFMDLLSSPREAS
ncbi:uncharacterized protein LOC108035688 isoform X2 [Drosophila biarmipes]|uniref:uncharacterized protein LOC108035688 isoform X2 n=1 Tax=Drosophila biarmipes TaxID=125945 RepID=UPI0007E7650B|nr:uncharacterized protein LOC108035688 isoform X2 [Drosophila biarmipes]